MNADTAALVEFRFDRRITSEEEQQLFGWGRDIYADECYQLQWRPRDWRLFVYADGLLVGHVGLIRHSVRVAGHPVRVGGMGQVVTVPTAQGRGYAQMALQTAAVLLRRELCVAFGVLFCIPRMVPFYARLGWLTVPDPVWIEQPVGVLVSPMPVMVLPCQGQDWPPGTVELRSLPW